MRSSLKDLSLADRIAELTEMGVASLKIEGRMKRPEYVAAAVSAIRTACEGRPVDFETLRSVFSRSGFTKGYFDGRIDREMFGLPPEGGCHLGGGRAGRTGTAL